MRNRLGWLVRKEGFDSGCAGTEGLITALPSHQMASPSCVSSRKSFLFSTKEAKYKCLLGGLLCEPNKATKKIWIELTFRVEWYSHSFVRKLFRPQLDLRLETTVTLLLRKPQS